MTQGKSGERTDGGHESPSQAPDATATPRLTGNSLTTFPTPQVWLQLCDLWLGPHVHDGARVDPKHERAQSASWPPSALLQCAGGGWFLQIRSPR